MARLVTYFLNAVRSVKPGGATVEEDKRKISVCQKKERNGMERNTVIVSSSLLKCYRAKLWRVSVVN